MTTTPYLLLALGLLVVVLSILIGVLAEVWRDKEMLNDILCRIEKQILNHKKQNRNGKNTSINS